ncbi:MAG: hypothetical protein OJJ21_19825 [Ferrovibrio sp.]|uniref:hypothetical protein n=1 Tax=Ferrovibrio sp. TaxID=1917215 RepID=UPI002637EAC3|nr:hypothetical protein [Ferrovibrio sp.]MCW0235856.1 hypothetical protein [Ferrovibrio sp.]
MNKFTQGLFRQPVYAPLAFDYDRAAVEAELLALVPLFRPILVNERHLLPENRRRWFMVADDEQLDHMDRHRNGQAIIGRYRSLEGLGLRRGPTGTTMDDSVTTRKADDCAGWDWDARYDIPLTRTTIERLPFARLRGVRLLSLPPGGFLPAHVDAADDSYWENGHATLSLLVASGGQPMLMLMADGGLQAVSDAAFLFRDSVPHGVAPVPRRRLLLRISGICDQAALAQLLA